MKQSQFFAPTLRDDPADAEVISHKLLLRAGFVRRVTAGVYDYLPLGLRVLRKIEAIIREEMNRAGAQELLLPMVQPSELWQQSGRWEKYGRELLRFVDRHDHESCLGPTHEEVICDLVARELRSYRQLPMNLYQIQGKFRDEVRPRFGLMRGREFIMKDAYSFHHDVEDLHREYRNMFDTYMRIFTRLGLKFRAVEADTGSIGGDYSHEFHVLADSGEDLIAHCGGCDYAANVEKAVSKRKPVSGKAAALAKVDTPDVKAVEDVAAFLKVAPSMLVKTLMYRVSGGADDGEVVAVCIHGDDQMQEVKLTRVLGAAEVVLAEDAEIQNVGGVAGFVGPQGLKAKVIVDESLKGAAGLVAGANVAGQHVTGFDFSRDVPEAVYADVRSVQTDDACCQCGGKIGLSRGIEVGHVFELGTRYSEPMNVCFHSEAGQRAVAEMGCYGIGVSRLMAAVVEQCHDERGICWPVQLAPFHVALISLGQSEAVEKAAAELYQQFSEAGIEVVWDDRKERPGVKFSDAELMGMPVRVVVGDRSLERGEVEIKTRAGGEAAAAPDAVVDQVRQLLGFEV